MPTLPLGSSLLGRSVARPVYDRDGRVLLAEGTRLTEKHLAALEKRGIARVAVQDELVPDLASDDPLDTATRQRVLTALQATFAAAARDEPLPIALLDAAVDDLIDALRRRQQVFSCRVAEMWFQ